MRAILVLVVMLVSACVTPYGRSGFMGGYDEVEIKPGEYYVEVSGNAYTSSIVLVSYFHRRAKELCGTTDYAWNMEGSTSTGPMSYVTKERYGELITKERPGVTKGAVTGLVTCRPATADDRP